MRQILSATVLCVAAAIAPVAISAQTVGELAGAYGARPAVKQVAISPSGRWLSYIGPSGHEDDVLYIVDLDSSDPPTAVLEVAEEMTSLSWCLWANDERLVCRIGIIKDDSGITLTYSRIFSMTRDGSDSARLSEAGGRFGGQPQSGGRLLKLDIEGKPDRVLMGRGGRIDEVSLVSTNRDWPSESYNRSAEGYVVDENGRARIMISTPFKGVGNETQEVKYFYRTKDSDEWKVLSTAEFGLQTSSGFRPVAVDSAQNIAYGYDKREGYDSLYAIKLDGSNERTLILGRTDVDIDYLIRFGRKDRVLGVSYATEKRQIEYFDDEMSKLAAGLSKSLPGGPSISWIDADAAENRLIFVASSDTDPGMVYMFDKGTRQVSELFPVRDYLGQFTMGPMKPVTFPAADGTEIPGYLTLPPGSDGKDLPTIVMPHGGPGSRDVWGFDWLVQFFVARGYAVMQPNYRGSAGYGDAWFGKNGFQAWRTAVGDVNDAARWLISSGVADPDKTVVVGWSYGGYASLQSQVIEPDLFKAVVAIAPVTDLRLLKDQSRDFTNYARVRAFVGSGAHIAAGSPAQNAEMFKAPVLLLHGDLDQSVGYAHSRLMKGRLEGAGKSVKLIKFDELGHSLDSHKARSRLLLEADMFLSEALGDK